MEVVAPYDNYVLIALGGYLLIVIFLIIKSTRLKKYGIQTKATIISIHEKEHDSGSEEFNDTSISYQALIEFKTTEGELISAKIPIAKRYLTEEYKKGLPIIYHRKRAENPIINDDLYIYKFPIALTLILVVFGIIILCILSFGGGK